jgi:hypothetical protein
MGKYLDEVKKLTRDPGAHRAAEICDALEARLNVCCPPDDINPPPTLAKAKAAAPAAESENPETRKKK